MLLAAWLMAGALAAQDAVPTPSTPPAAPAPQGAVAGNRVTVTGTFAGRAVRVPLPYEAVNGLIVFKAKIAGREVWALLDTGAERSIIDTGLAAAAGLTVGPPEGTIRTSTGTVANRRVSDVSIAIDKQFEITSPAVAGMDLKPISDVIGRKVEFVLGAEFLGMMQVMIDPGRRTINLLPSGAFKAPPNFPSVPLMPGFRIEALVGDKPVLVMIDTGATTSLVLRPEAWARVAPPDVKMGASGVVGANGQLHLVDVALAPKVSIGAVTRDDVKVQVRPWPNGKGDGAVGMGLLGQVFLVLDVRVGKLWLMPRLSSSVTP